MLCPRCKRNAIVYEPWSTDDLVAVCRSVRRCGWRMHMPNMSGMPQPILDRYVETYGASSLVE
jgi:hypothetical protein